MKDENPFQQKLYNHTMPVREAVWENIEARLPGQKDQKKFPFFWFSLFTALILGGAIFVYATQFNTSASPSEESLQQNNLPQTSAQNQEAFSYQNSSENISALQPSASTSIDSPAGYGSGDVNEIVSTDASGKTATASTKAIDSPWSNIQISRRNSPTVFVLNEKTENDISSEILTANVNAVASLRAGLKIYDLLPLSDNLLPDAVETHDLKRMFKIKPDPSCYKFTGEEGRSNLSIDIFGGPGFSPRSFENNSPESILYAEARNATERNQYSLSAGARVNLNLSHEWAVRLGVLYEQTGDIFDYTDTLATQQTTRIDSFFAADGTFLYAETNTELILGTLIKKIHNRYHHLDIPLLASYEMPMGRATLMVNAGPVINLMTSVRGQILDAGLVPHHITQDEPNQLHAYKTNVGLSVYLGAGALFPICKNISGLVEPRFLYRIKPVTLDTYQLKEHRHFAGLNLGIRYHLN